MMFVSNSQSWYDVCTRLSCLGLLAVNNLTVTNVIRPADVAAVENNITVQWDPPSVLGGTQANYRASISPGEQSSAWGTDRFATFIGLMAGTRYTVTVMTRTTKDDYGQATAQYTTPGHVFYTSKCRLLLLQG